MSYECAVAMAVRHAAAEPVEAVLVNRYCLHPRMHALPPQLPPPAASDDHAPSDRLGVAAQVEIESKI